MTEHIKESFKWAAAIAGSLISAIAGLWWGIRMGSGLDFLTGINFRPLLCVLMIAGLIFQGYTGIKKSRKFNTLYRVCVWISGILVSLLLYSLFILVLADIAVSVLRAALHIHYANGYNLFSLEIFGIHPRPSASEYARIWGSSVWNSNRADLPALVLSALITCYGIVHARMPRNVFYRIPLRKKGDTEGRSVASEDIETDDTVSSGDLENSGIMSRDERPSRTVSVNMSTHDVKSRRMKSSTERSESCRIVQLSDLHMGSVIGPHYIHKIVQNVIALKPDYVVLTGDIFNHGFVEECPHPEKAAGEFMELSRHCKGIFAVLGNHDPAPDDPALQTFLKRGNITLLYNQSVCLPELNLAGWGGNHLNGRPIPDDWLTMSADGRPLIFLDHYPDGIHEAQKAGASIMLCGHTHAGQYFPCTLLIRKQYPKKNGLAHGLSRWGLTWNIVSSGTGFFQIPIRVGTNSEIVVVDILP